MQITVQGYAGAAFPPERATVRFAIGLEGPDKQKVLKESTDLANAFAAAVEELRRELVSPITWSAMLPMGTRSWRPYSNTGEVMPLRHGASAVAKVKFRDFKAMAAFIDRWGGQGGIAVQGVEWTLTEQRRLVEEGKVLTRAVEAAKERAQVMATAAGFGSVRFLEVSDPGLLSIVVESGRPETMALKARGAAYDSGEGTTISPEDVELDATVHARFTTD